MKDRQARGAKSEPWTRERIEALLASAPNGFKLSLREQYLAGLDLTGLDLSKIHMNRANLTKAILLRTNLEGAYLTDAILTGANLKSANLTEAILFRTNLEGANLTEAVLTGANLKSANLTEVILRGANLEGANLTEAILEGACLDVHWTKKTQPRITNLQDATLERADLRKANFSSANLGKANLYGANLEKASMTSANLQEANLIGTNLREARLGHAYLQRAELSYSNLEGADLVDTNLQGAMLTGANLQEVNLSRTVLQGADLQFADLRGVQLTNVGGSNLNGIYLYGAKLDRTDLTTEMLGTIGEERRKLYYQAKEAYLALKQNFDSLGRYDDASWAYVKEQQMEKAMHNPFLLWRELAFPHQGVIPQLWLNRLSSKRDRLFIIAGKTLKWAADWLVELLCGYGESIWRVAGWMILTILVFGPLLTKLGGGLYFINDTWTFYWSIKNPIFRWFYGYAQYLLYTVSAFTTMDSDNLKAGNDLVRLFTAREALIGIFLTGLLGFVAGNRIRRS